MQELLKLIFSFQFKKLFFEKTDNELIKFFRYAFVGGIAFVVDYGAFVAVCQTGDTKLINALASVVGFIAGLTANFILSRKFVFQEKSNTTSAYGEFIGYAVIGVIGLGLNIGLLFLGTELLSVNRYIAKIIAALIVLVYNYVARKVILYTPSKKKDRGQ